MLNDPHHVLMAIDVLRRITDVADKGQLDSETVRRELASTWSDHSDDRTGWAS